MFVYYSNSYLIIAKIKAAFIERGFVKNTGARLFEKKVEASPCDFLSGHDDVVCATIARYRLYVCEEGNLLQTLLQAARRFELFLACDPLQFERSPNEIFLVIRQQCSHKWGFLIIGFAAAYYDLSIILFWHTEIFPPTETKYKTQCW